MRLSLIINNVCISTTILPWISVRNISLHSHPERNKYFSREVNMMNKLLGSSKKKKKLYFENTQPQDIKFSAGKKISSSKENSRRIAVLNTLFIKHISDLLMTGNIGENVLDKGLQISGVAMAPAFNQLNVFWISNNEENTTALETILPQLGFTLRHELSQLQVMGIVPRITFIQDKHHKTVMKIDHLLSIADYGEDHTPVNKDLYFTNSYTESNLQESRKEHGKNLETGVSEEEVLPEETMPAMRHDVFSLDHHQIMEKILKGLKKSRATHRFQPNLAVETKGMEIDALYTSTDYMTKHERKEALAKFILERKILKEKRLLNKYNADPNVPFNKETENNEDWESEEFEVDEDYFDEESLEEKEWRN